MEAKFRKKWTVFAEGFRARILVVLDAGGGSRVRGLVYSLNSREYVATYDPATSSLKTALSLFPEDLMPFSARLPKWGTMRNGAVYRRPMLELGTDASGGGVSAKRESNNGERIMFPTINTSGKGGGSHIFARINPLRDSGAITQEEWEAFGGYEYTENSNAHKEYTKKEERTLFPTPTVRDCHSVGPSDMDRRSPKLDTVVTMIPTPTSRDWKGQGEPGREEVKKMAKEFSESERCVYPTPTTTGFFGGTGSMNILNQLQEDGTITPEEKSHLSRGWPGGKLNPAWVEWLMGWPIGWTALKPLETVRFPLAPPQPS